MVEFKAMPATTIHADLPGEVRIALPVVTARSPVALIVCLTQGVEIGHGLIAS